jgi:hypothetical protein
VGEGVPPGAFENRSTFRTHALTHSRTSLPYTHIVNTATSGGEPKRTGSVDIPMPRQT